MGVQQMWLWAGQLAWELPLPSVRAQPRDLGARHSVWQSASLLG